MPHVLVPGAGGPAAHGAIKSLRMAGMSGRIITTDSNWLSAGFALADGGAVLPKASSPQFIDDAMALIEREQIDVILPTSGFDIEPYSRHRARVEAAGAVVAFSDHPVIELCNDKLALFQALAAAKVVDLGWFTMSPQNATFPCFVKPRSGKGSRSVFRCDDDASLRRALGAAPDMLMQEYFPGREYSIDVLSDMLGRARVAVPRERLETKAGISSKGRVVRNPAMEQTAMAIVDYLGIKGPSNVQMKEDKDGCPRLEEINPRLGGATVFATLAGVNLPYLTVQMAMGEPCAVPSDFREITVVRHYEEVVLT